MRIVRSVAAVVVLSACMLSAQQPAPAQNEPAPQLAKGTAFPQIVMLRLYVSDIVRAEKFYSTVFDAKVAQRMGDRVRIMMLPRGATPGIILIQSPDVATMHGSFVIQVPNLEETLNLAAANGATLKHTHFEQQTAGMPAQSSHFADPDGNLIEVLQIGAAAGRRSGPGEQVR